MMYLPIVIDKDLVITCRSIVHLIVVEIVKINQDSKTIPSQVCYDTERIFFDARYYLELNRACVFAGFFKVHHQKPPTDTSNKSRLSAYRTKHFWLRSMGSESLRLRLWCTLERLVGYL